jgi:hypothetical protein
MFLEEEGTSQELQQLFQLPNVFRRRENQSGAPAAVPVSQCFYILLADRGLSEEEETGQELQQLFQFPNVFIFYFLTGDCQKRREPVRSSSSILSFTMSLFLLAYRGLSEEEGTSQELQQMFQLHDVFISYLFTGDCQKRREQVRSSISCSALQYLYFLLAYRRLSEEEGTGTQAEVSASQYLYFLLAYWRFSEEEGTGTQAEVSASKCLVTCLQGTVRRGGNKSGTPAAVSASQYLYFLLAYRGLSEEEETSQELQ